MTKSLTISQDNNLTLDPEPHIYRFDGCIVPGISEILQSAGIKDYSGINPEILRKAQQFGSAVHLACALDDRDNLGECDEAIIPYLEGWRKFKKESGITFEVIEQSLYSNLYQFAGTPDRLGHNLKHYIIEIKTGAKEHWHGLQAAAQELIFLEYYHWRKYQHWIIHLMPGKYKIEPIPSRKIEFNKKTFLSCLQIHNWKQSIKKEFNYESNN